MVLSTLILVWGGDSEPISHPDRSAREPAPIFVLQRTIIFELLYKDESESALRSVENRAFSRKVNYERRTDWMPGVPLIATVDDDDKGSLRPKRS